MVRATSDKIFNFAMLGLVFAMLLPAQQQTGSMIGTVVDPSGSNVPGAEVTVKNAGTTATFTAVTDGTGFWRAPQLNPGVYDISVAAKGFSTIVRQGVEVRVADRLRIDFTLQVGAVSDTVTITGSAPLLQVEDAALGQVVDNRTMVELPLNGRNWLQLASLTPATVSGPTGPVNIGGLRTNQQQYLLDGADNTNLIAGGVAFSPPIDALQEFKVQTSNFTADTAGFSGAVLNATVKSGSNTFHGNAYEFLRNRSLNARNFFALPTAPKPQLNRNNYGASIGGPFVKNKVFFFLNYDVLSQRQANTTSTTVFTDAQKRGDFSTALGGRVGSDAAGNTVSAGQIFNPFSLHTVNGTLVRDPFPGNIVPDSLINPVSRKLINMVPAPVLPGSPNYIVSISAPVDNKNYLGRVDWTHSSKDNIYSHVGYTSGLQTAACLFALPVCGGAGNGLTTTTENYQISAGWTHIFSPTTINELTLGNTRTVSTRDLLGSDTDYNGQYGIPFPFQGPHMGSLAFLGIAGYTGIGSAAAGGPYFQFVNKFEVSDNLTVIRGKHGLKFGFNGRLKLFHNQWSSNFGHGAENFTGIYTRQIGFPTSGNSIADYLLGVANDASFGNIVHEKDIWRDLEAYVQDKWAVTPKLTVSLGVRYFNNPPSWEARDQVASVLTGPGYHNPVIVVPKSVDDTTYNFVANTLFPFMTTRRATELNRGMVYPIHGSWAPRLGIAYQLSKKTVVRTGFGVFYGFPEQVGGNILGVNPPSRLVLNNTSDGINPTILIDKAAFGATPFNRALNNPPGDFLSIRDPYSPPEMTLMYNLSVQHEFLPGWLLEVGYTGNQGKHIYVNTSINDATPALPTDNSSIQSRRIATPLLGNLPFYAPQGSSNYNALTVNLEKRFAGGFSVLSNYTFSRALGNTDAAAKSPYDLRDSYGSLSFDVRNHFVFSGVWDLPFGKGKALLSNIPAVANQFVGGWELTGIATLQGGTRVTPSLSLSLGRTTTNSRPDVIADPIQGAARQPYNWINPAAFAIPTNAQIAAGDFFGNSGAGVIANPGLVNFDLSALKNFSVKERVRVQFRAEFFNSTNTPFFGGLGTVVGTPTFGKLTSASDPRVVQLGLKVVF
jgi:Carboxypeptidase regulatory-like domain